MQLLCFDKDDRTYLDADIFWNRCPLDRLWNLQAYAETTGKGRLEVSFSV
jgi:hypothetical protein